MRTGGAESVVARLVRASASRGVECAIVAEPGDLASELDVACYPIRLLERHPLRLPGAVRDVRRALAAFRPDVCHVHNPGMAVVTALATRRPALATVHGLPAGDYPRAARLLRWGRLPVVSCGPGVDEALRAEGLRPHRMVPNGVAPAPAPIDRRDVLRAWRLPPQSRLVVGVGRLAAVKNQALAIRALPEMPAAVRLILIGEGPERDALEALAARLDVAGRVVFAGTRADARAIQAVADVAVSTSTSEGMSLAICEAMADRRPVVATDVRGSREIIDDGRTGLLVPAGDATGFAVAVTRLLDDPALGGRLGAAAAEAVSGYTETAMVDGYLELYRELAR